MREREPATSGALGDEAAQGRTSGQGLGFDAGLEAAQPIPTPWRVRWDRFSHGVLPLIVFLAAVALTVYLWRRHNGLASAVGAVEAEHVAVTSPVAGTLVPVARHFGKLDYVRKDEVVARLETGSLITRRNELRDEVRRLEAFLGTMGGASATEPADAAGGPATRPSPPRTSGDGSLLAAEANLRAAVANAQREIERLDTAIAGAEIRSPIAGRVTRVHLRPGQNVQPGERIMEVVEERGSYIISYIRRDTAFQPTLRTPVEVHPRIGPKRQYGSLVSEVGARLEAVPEEQLMDPKRPEWGLPIRIPVPAGASLRPGELVNLIFRTPEK